MYLLKINNNIIEKMNPLHGFFNSPENDNEAKRQANVRITHLSIGMGSTLKIENYQVIKRTSDLFGDSDLIIQ